jgi:DNA-directed RNA polymerase specialized sigma24 family protein
MKKEKNVSSLRDLRMDVQYALLEQVIKQCFKEVLQEVKNEKKEVRTDEVYLLKICDIAKRFKVTKSTIHNWINRGLITGRKLGKNRYFTEQEVIDALTSYGWQNHDVVK